MTPSVTVRPVASFAEFRAGSRVVRLAWRAAFDHIISEAALPPTELDEDRASELKAAYETASAANESHIVAVADEESADTGGAVTGGESIVGYARGVWDPVRTESFAADDDAELRALYVRPDHWGEGIGSALLSSLESNAPAGVDRLALQTFADNEDGCAFYRTRGFEVVGENTYEVGDESYPTVVFAKPLEAE
ncbi:acetyltransferase (gnat) family protein [Halogeometricum borinquense DSM 11551]|uniref:acetyltransferase (GNAT) family protein n=1 Tax=Halogeometricum borinquense (strain ATCC 700274 / DSM 11551 / JCM 10706 / KCTC 4070 / PR3) TaxID=469382 RepID=E4NSX8_HALBP|nr:GNAT family N-acetyltransferase [Halogeometricum borinquense]ADQ65866.1 acetyltransferase (GNAT) family protein [Halogeometricum borinquense DSM 11551]ELY26868.1 acetyltransferase (gnat) family protein [Halogeometricum borinquense DSM 11551]